MVTQIGNFATIIWFLLPSSKVQMYAGTLTIFKEAVGVHSNSTVTTFVDGGKTPHSGAASKDFNSEGSGKLLTFFSLEKKASLTPIIFK